MMGSNSQRLNRTPESRKDHIDYNLIYAISFAACLAANAGVWLAHWPSLKEKGSEAPRNSVLQKARSDASTIAAFAFMQ